MDCLDFLFSDETPLPAPCFVLDEARLAANAAILDEVQRRTGAKILLALKGYAAWATFPLLSRTGTGPPRRKSPSCWIWRTILSLIPRLSGGNSGPSLKLTTVRAALKIP